MWRIWLIAGMIGWLVLLGAAHAQDIRAIGAGPVKYVPLNCRMIREIMTADFRARLSREARADAEATNLVIKMAREIAAACAR